MKTIAKGNIVLGLLASVASLTVGCGSDGSSSDGAATGASVQTTTLAINLDGAAAIGTTGGSGLRLADGESGVVAINVEGKVIGDALKIDSPYVKVLNSVLAGDGSMLVYVNTGSKFENGVMTTYDVTLPGGKSVKDDCSGSIRIKNGTADCLVLDKSAIPTDEPDYLSDNILDNPASVKVDALGNLFIERSPVIYRVDNKGVAKVLVKNESGATLLSAMDDGTAVVLINDVLRLYSLSGSSKSISGQYLLSQAGSYLVTNAGLFNSTGSKMEISGLTSASCGATALNLTGTTLQMLCPNGKLTKVDLDAKTSVTEQLSNSKEIILSTFVGTDLYYATIDGVRKVSTGLGLTAAVTETAVEGLSDISIFSMTKVGDRVLFSGQSDSNSGYVTGAIEGTEATVNTADTKITSIQSL